MDFIIRKDIYGSWWHDFNNNATKVNISDFECVIDEVANTFIIQNKNGSNVPSKAVSIADVKVINQIVSNTPISFSGAVGLKNLLTSLNYTPYVTSGGGSGAVDSVNGQTGVVIIPLDYLPLAGGTMDADADIFFDNGSKISEGALDAGTGGNKGIALTCAVDYEFKWEAGEVYITQLSGNQLDGKYFTRSLPTPTDDASKGFYAGSKWLTLSNQIYECSDPTVGNAVWDLVVTPTPTLDQVLTVGDKVFDSISGDRTWQPEDRLKYWQVQSGVQTLDDTVFPDNSLIEGVIQNDDINATVTFDFDGVTPFYLDQAISTVTLNVGDFFQLKHFSGGTWILTVTNKSSGVPTLQQVTDEGNVTSNDVIVRNPDDALKQVIIKRATDGDDTSSVFAQYDTDTYIIAYAQEGASAIAGSLYDPAGNGEFTLSNGLLSTSNSLCSMLFQGGNLYLSSLVDQPYIGMSGVGNSVSINTNLLTGNRLQELPDKDGTFAMLDDIPAAGVTSVGLTMPSAFTVTNSPITSSGDIAVTGSGAVSQYVRGDGSLANFPTSSGAGSSLSFYLNGSVSQGTFGGVAFKEMDRTPILGAGTDFTINANGYIQSFITDAGVPNLLEIPAGNWNFETYFSASSGGGSPSFYVELYKWNGTTLSLIASNSATPENITGGTSIDLYVSALAVPQTALLATDRLAVRIYVTHSGRTITLHTEDNHLCQAITTFSTGLTALNGLTAQVQNLAVGTTGTDFGIVSSGSTHTFNIPNASAANRGLLTSADWTTFNSKASTAYVDAKVSDAIVDGVTTVAPSQNAVFDALALKQDELFDFNTRKGFNFFEDFLGNPLNSNFNSYGISTATSGTGAQVAVTTSYPNRTNQQGVVQLGSGTTLTGLAQITLGISGGTSHYLGNGVYTIQTFVNIETLSTSLERFYAIIGSTTNANLVNTNGIFFIYDEGGIGAYGVASPNFKCVTSNAFTRTLTTTSTPVVASQWYNLKIVVNAAATSVEFFIDGTSVATHTTNIPTVITPKIATQKTVGVTNRNMFCDYLAVKQIYTNPR
jgi:hypothetical protein